MTGFGIDGEPGTGGAADTIAQALSGIMLTGGEESDPPVRLGAPLGDTITPLCTIIGILSALEHVRFTGVGERVDTSMVGALTALVAIEPFDLLEVDGRAVSHRADHGAAGHVRPVPVRGRVRGDHRRRAAGRRAVSRDWQARAGRDDARFAGPARARNYRELTAEIEEWTRTLTVAECVATLERRGVPCAAVRAPGEAVADPLARRTRRHGAAAASDARHRKPISRHRRAGSFCERRQSASTDPRRRPASTTTTSTAGLLGYSAERIAELRANGVI